MQTPFICSVLIKNLGSVSLFSGNFTMNLMLNDKAEFVLLNVSDLKL